MIKSLLRTLPSFSGNVKLACNIIDSRTTNDKDVWEASVRGARIIPISSHMWQSGLEAGLVSSSWEYDLPKFYSMYSNIFYSPCFEFDKLDMLKLDTSVEQKVRNTDFEFGVKRISYTKNGKQFGFFAPLYIDSIDDLPDYFLIEATIEVVNKDGDTVYAIKRKLRVNIGNEVEYKKAYLGRYLSRYLSNIDDNVAFCTPVTNQATFYGIDLVHGGFVTAVDNMMDRVYHYHNTIHNVDATITGAFKRNSIAMKQILPLAFYFSMQDMLTEQESIRYRSAYVTFSGAYYKDGKKLPMYDWSMDYMNYTEEILRMDPMSGSMLWTTGLCKNIMDVSFPSLNECRYINYEFANKVAPWFCRWKLKYSSDEHPYIINNSWAFSKNQDSYYKYGQFPSTYSQQNSLAKYFVDSSGIYNYDMRFPVGDINNINSGRYMYAYAPEFDKSTTGPYNYVISNYENILNNYGSNWYNVIPEYSDNIYNNESIWQDVVDNRIYYNGILYDLTNIYEELNTNKRIDKFAVLMHPDMHILPKEELAKLYFSQYSLYRAGVSQISNTNVIANDSIFTIAYKADVPNYMWADDTWLGSSYTKVYQDKMCFDEIFVEDNEDGNFIDMMSATYFSYPYNVTDGEGNVTYSKYAIDYYELDKYYNIDDADYVTKVANDIVLDAYESVEDEEVKSMIAAYVLPNYGTIGHMHAYVSGAVNSYAWIPTTRFFRMSYSAIPAYIFDPQYAYSYDASVYHWAKTHNDSIVNIAYSDSKISSAHLLKLEKYRPYYNILVSESGTQLNINVEDDRNILTAVHGNGEFIETNLLKKGDTVSSPQIVALDTVDETWDKTVLELFSEHAYVRNSSNDTDIMTSAYVYGKFSYSNGADSYSYIASNDISQAENNYGSQLYWKALMLPSSYIPYMTPDYDSYSYMSGWAASLSYNVDDLKRSDLLNDWENMKETHPAAYWSGCLRTWKSYVSSKIAEKIYKDPSICEWEYYPLVNYNDLEVARDVFYERTDWTDHMYGNMIPQSKIMADNNVLWADPYNFADVYGEEYKSYLDNAVMRDMYVKFLNKDHLFYWYMELYKDKDRKYDGSYDYSKFINYEWYRHIYVAEDVIIYGPTLNEHMQSIPIRRRVYTPLMSFINFPEYYRNDDPVSLYRSFSAFYNRINYDTESDTWTLEDFTDIAHNIECKRYSKEEEELIVNQKESGESEIVVSKVRKPLHFDLVFKKTMMRVDEHLWNLTNIGQDVDMYRDIYFYRMCSIPEIDATLDGVRDIDIRSDYSYISNSITDIYTYTYIQEKTYDNKIDNSVPQSYTIYRESTGIYKDPIVLADDATAYILHSDSMLVPMFDDIFSQPPIDAEIYTHYSLHDITTADVVSDLPDKYTGEYERLYTNYRYNVSDKKMMVEMSPEELKLFKFNKRYKRYNETWCKMMTNNDDDELPNDLGMADLGLSTKTINGTNYGFYFIKSHFNNTSDSLWINGVTGDKLTTHVKYIKYINGHILENNQLYISSIFKELVPFIDIKPLSAMSDVTTIVHPYTYSFDMIYSQLPAANNGSTETDIILNDNKISSSSLLRYFHAMTPLIVPTTAIDNEWRLKLKDVSANLLDTARFLSLGDAPIYSTHVHINKFTPYAVYTKHNSGFTTGTTKVSDYNNKAYDYTPVEYKFYNASRGVILEPHIKVDIKRRMTYDELLDNETDEVVMNTFKDYIKRTRKMFSDEELVFLLNKYKVSFDSVPVGLDITHTKKLYTLSILFDLL